MASALSRLDKFPVKPRSMWCMFCLECSVESFEPRSGKPLEINCFLDNHETSVCRACFGEGYSYCKPAAAGMLGDAQDLTDVLEWVESLLFSGTDEYRVAVLTAVQRLCACFVTAEAEHRKFHGIGELCGDGNWKDYHVVLAQRRQLVGYGEDGHLKPLRLLPGDDGYMALAVAKQRFWEYIQPLVKEQHGKKGHPGDEYCPFPRVLSML